MSKYSNSKDLAKVVKAYVRQGWRYRHGRRHGRLVSPSGKSVPVPCTPSDYRALANFKHDLRRYG